MKLQIDTDAKIIKVEQVVKITEFMSLVKKLLPNDWKEYSIQCVEYLNHWYNPISVPYTFTYDWITQSGLEDLGNGFTYNIETNN